MTDEREKRFMMVVRQALKMIVAWIEKEYELSK
jgi:hypothetical protein